jgi:dolichol-phosphate mannosyltransferase
VAALAELVYDIVQFVRGQTVPGWASLAGLMALLFGVLFIVLGVIGTYLARIHELLQNRPPFVIEEQTGHPDDLRR